MATRAKRRKRDSVTNLYNQCQITGNCPPDVKNKVEGNTLADRLLKIFSSIIYTGGLGIGTGKGTGGSTGYTPLGGAGGGRLGAGGTVVRPNIAVDPLGPAEVIPVDTIDPGAPAIIPLSEGDPISVTENGVSGGLEPGVSTAGEDTNISVVTNTDPISDVTHIGGGPVVTSTEDTAAVLELQPSPSAPPKRVVTSTSNYTNPSFHTVFHSGLSTSGSAEVHILVDSSIGGSVVGGEGEFIELDLLNRPEEFEILDVREPRTSTPREGLNRALKRARDLYNRRVRQLPTRNQALISRPRQAVTFEFENPAFEDDVTQFFEQDLEQLASAPDIDFQDVVRLGSARLSETAEGRIRLSRLGQRGTIRTRSGAQIGEHVHFYYDFSTIEPPEAIDLSVLGETSGDATHIDAQAESILVDSENSNMPLLEHTEEDLLDTQSEDFSNSHLILQTSGRDVSMTTPTLPPGVSLKVFIDDYAGSLTIHHPTDTDFIGPVPIPKPPDVPVVVVDDYGTSDYILHPSLHRRKRKRPFY